MQLNLWLTAAVIVVCGACAGVAQDSTMPHPPTQTLPVHPAVLPSGQPNWIQLSPSAAILSALDSSVADRIAADAKTAKDQRIAAQQFEAIQVNLATLIKQYPNTTAGKAAAKMVDRAELRVGPDGYDGLYPKHTFFSGAAINR